MISLLCFGALCLGLCVASNFTTVFEWDNFDYAVEGRPDSYQPENIYPLYLAVFEQKIFLSLHHDTGVPVTLVSVSTANASYSSSPELSPFPSADLHGGLSPIQTTNCGKIQQTTGLEVDAAGRLWALDVGNEHCPAKLWLFDLKSSNAVRLVHTFPDSVVSHLILKRWLQDLVLDETLDDCFSYIADLKSEHLVAFSMKKRKSWPVKSEGKNFAALAVSSDRLFLRESNPKKLFSMPLSELRDERESVGMTLVGVWTETPYKMKMDMSCNLYASFYNMNYIKKWKITNPFEEQMFYEQSNSNSTNWPFTLAVDNCGTTWFTVDFGFQMTPRFALLKGFSTDFPSGRFCDSRGCNARATACDGEGGLSSQLVSKLKVLNVALVCSNAISLLLLFAFIFWANLLIPKGNDRDAIPAREPSGCDTTVPPLTESSDTAVEAVPPAPTVSDDDGTPSYEEHIYDFIGSHYSVSHAASTNSLAS